MGKKPLSEKQIKSLRKLIEGKPLHELLLNLSVDLMLRGSDLLNLKVADVVSESGNIKTEVKVKQKKTGKTTLSICSSPLSSIYLLIIFLGSGARSFIRCLRWCFARLDLRWCFARLDLRWCFARLDLRLGCRTDLRTRVLRLLRLD